MDISPFKDNFGGERLEASITASIDEAQAIKKLRQSPFTKTVYHIAFENKL